MHPNHSTAARPRVRTGAYLRAVIAITMLVVWTLAAGTGFLMWLAPEGPRSGQIPLLFGLAKRAWGDVHFWLSVVALMVTAVHVAVDWRALRGCIRYLTSAHRAPVVCE